MRYLNLLKINLCFGLVKRSPFISSVGRHYTDISPFWILSVTKNIWCLYVWCVCCLITYHFFQKNITLVVLVYDILSNSIALIFKKNPVPEDRWHYLVNSNYFWFNETPSVKLLLAWYQDWESSSHCQFYPSVPPNIRLYQMWYINVPLEHSTLVCT